MATITNMKLKSCEISLSVYDMDDCVMAQLGVHAQGVVQLVRASWMRAISRDKLKCMDPHHVVDED